MIQRLHALTYLMTFAFLITLVGWCFMVFHPRELARYTDNTDYVTAMADGYYKGEVK